MDEEESSPYQPPRRPTAGLDWSAATEPERIRESHEEEAASPQAKLGSRRGWWRTGVLGLACAVIGGVLGGVIVAVARDEGSAPLGTTPAATKSPAPTVNIASGSGLPAVIARVRPAVVKIESTRRTNAGVERDVGSGVLIDKLGHIVTNAHVVLGTETLKVILADGSELPAILIGHDSPFTDVAVLQIGPPPGIEPVTAGDSTSLQVGEPVVAIGNPLAEFAGSVSAGIVSGLNRKRTFDGVRQDDFIQTDAPLNNGNSGGALLNAAGEFIGMPTAVLRQNPGGSPVQGIGFAVPSARVMSVAQVIIASGGAYPRPTLGLDHLDLTADATPRACRLGVDTGAVVIGLAPGGPAATAGVQLCDVITKVGDDPVDHDHPLLNALVSREAGQTVKVVLNRNGRIIEAEVRLARRG